MLDTLKPLGPQWFSLFRKRLADIWEENWGSSDANWTRHMIAMLKDMGEVEGYQVDKEPGKKDLVWLRANNIEVHIEHENSGDDWEYLRDHEVRDLLDTSARLKVLITYVRKSVYPANDHARRIGALLQKRGKWDAEFLLVVSPWEPVESADYVAHHFQASFSRRLLVIPSGGNR